MAQQLAAQGWSPVDIDKRLTVGAFDITISRDCLPKPFTKISLPAKWTGFRSPVAIR